jgi:hypothetical protein
MRCSLMSKVGQFQLSSVSLDQLVGLNDNGLWSSQHIRFSAAWRSKL